MRILIIHQNFVDHRHPGGTRHLDVATRLVAKGHEVTVVASTVDYLTGTQIKAPRQETYKGVVIKRAWALPTVQKSIAWRAISYVSYLPAAWWTALRSGPADVVFGTTPPVFQLPPTWLIAKMRRAPFVLEVLDLWPEFAIGMGVLKNPVLIWIARTVEQFFNHAAKHLVVNSPAYKDYLIDHGRQADDVTTIVNGVDPEMFEPDEGANEIRRRFQLDGKFVVTYSGALGMANDLSTIVRAANLVQDDPDIHFLLAGDGKERTKLEAEAKALNLTNITFGGFFPKDQMKNVLAASDACVATLLDIPQFKTPFPNKVFDYMTAGKPVLLGIDGAIRKVVDEANAGIFVQPSNEQSLADAVRHLKANPDEAKAMGQRGQQHIVSHYHMDRQADRFEEVFLKVVQK
ncbi:MAG: glycosyltransferase family 4 protein [Pirellulaceae bacterium]